MTDLEKLKNLLAEFEVPFEQFEEVGMNKIRIEAGSHSPKFMSDKIDGYGGFYIDYEFDLSGKFVKLWIGE